LTLKAVCKLLDSEPKEDVQAAIADLKKDYDRPGGLQFVEVAGGYQIATRPDLHEWVRRLFHERSTQKLTVQGLRRSPSSPIGSQSPRSNREVAASTPQGAEHAAGAASDQDRRPRRSSVVRSSMRRRKNS
jgi:hypothetical protein